MSNKSEEITIQNAFEMEDKGFICLKYTCQINEDMLRKPIYKWLKNNYKGVKSSVGRAMCSILNSILFQDRIIFVMTRKEAQSMVCSDKNHKNHKKHKSSFSNKLWPVIIAKMCDANIIKFIYHGKGKIPNAFEVVHPDLLKTIQGKNRDEQLIETVEFLDKRNNKDNEND